MLGRISGCLKHDIEVMHWIVASTFSSRWWCRVPRLGEGSQQCIHVNISITSRASNVAPTILPSYRSMTLFCLVFLNTIQFRRYRRLNSPVRTRSDYVHPATPLIGRMGHCPLAQHWLYKCAILIRLLSLYRTHTSVCHTQLMVVLYHGSQLLLTLTYEVRTVSSGKEALDSSVLHNYAGNFSHAKCIIYQWNSLGYPQTALFCLLR